jgi:hypothetical protein
MQALENRTLDSKREMDIMSALDELKSMSSRHERVDTEAALAALRRSAVEDGEPEISLDDADEAAVRQMIVQQRKQSIRRHPPLPSLGILCIVINGNDRPGGRSRIGMAPTMLACCFELPSTS